MAYTSDLHDIKTTKVRTFPKKTVYENDFVTATLQDADGNGVTIYLQDDAEIEAFYQVALEARRKGRKVFKAGRDLDAAE